MLRQPITPQLPCVASITYNSCASRHLPASIASSMASVSLFKLHTSSFAFWLKNFGFPPWTI